MMNTRKFTAKKAVRSVPILLRAVRRGQRIAIIDRGRTIAIMEPAEPKVPTWWERQRAVEALRKRRGDRGTALEDYAGSW